MVAVVPDDVVVVVVVVEYESWVQGMDELDVVLMIQHDDDGVDAVDEVMAMQWRMPFHEDESMQEWEKVHDAADEDD